MVWVFKMDQWCADKRLSQGFTRFPHQRYKGERKGSDMDNFVFPIFEFFFEIWEVRTSGEKGRDVSNRGGEKASECPIQEIVGRGHLPLGFESFHPHPVDHLFLF